MNSEHDFLNVNGTRLYVETAGSGDPVVLIPGFTLDTRMWDDQFVPLAERLRVIRYDLRGFGRSALPSGEAYSHVDDLQALLDRLEVPQATLVGLSKGGAVAIEFALTHPQRTRALVLIDTVLPGFAWSPELSARDGLVWQRAAEGGIPAAKESWLTHPLFVPAQSQPAVAARIKQIVDDYSGWHFVNSNPERGLDPPAARRLGELGMPVLAMAGELDVPDFRQITDLVCQQVPQARKRILSGVGHMSNMEAPEQVTAEILAFFEDSLSPIDGGKGSKTSPKVS
jgi:pimeloyl-ACP methyl ester carboxylesterase